MVIIQLNKVRVVCNKPIYLGYVVLELSKIHMYSFHYNHMLEKYHPSKITLNYMDTDSFIYHIKTKNLYNDMKKDISPLKLVYDTSNFVQDNVNNSGNTYKGLLRRYQ
jgi:hypothetical protein